MSSDALLLNGANRTLLNGKNLDYSDSSNQESSSMNSSSIEQTYDSLFPALPEGNNFGSSKSISQWSQNFLSPSKSESNSEGHAPKISKIRSSKISENFTIFSEEKRDTAKICAEIAKETDTEIERTTTSEGLAFLITGKIEKVKEAKKRIFAELTTPTIYELDVPKEAYGLILGKSGLKLKELENRSGAKIFMPKIDSNDLIRIKGSKEAIETAVHDIQLISSEALSKCKEVLSIDYEFHAFINGPFNETLQALQQETGAKINIPPYSFKKNEIVITGDQNAINNAKEKILKIYNQIKLNCETIPINIKKCQHKYIVGPKGSVLNEIFKQTGVAIQMPSDPTSEQIILRGEQSKLGLALTILYNKAHSEIILNIEAKSWIQRHLITLYGIRLQTLNENFSNVHVTFSFEEDLIKLSGPKEEVEKANKIILSRIESIESKIKVKEITVDPIYHKFIIGKGGNNIKKIREETGAQIIIPVANSQNANIITIQGNKDSIELADQKLQEIIKKAIEKEAQVSKDLNIEHRFHSQLIGIKGETIKEIRDKFNVYIAFPDSSIKSDKVTIRGEKNDVENCYKHLSTLHKKLLAENFRLELPVNKQVYKYIISLDNLKKIRNETETKIEFPNDDSNANMVVICGKKENVDKAKNLIKKIEKDELNFVQVDIIIPRKFHDSIIGKKKSIIRAIQEECDNVQITFPQINSNSDKVSIRGSKEGVAKAKKQLVDLSNDKQLNNYQEVLGCKFNFHKFLIGKNGSNINKVKDAHGVRVFFPKEDDAEQINEITIIGKKENVLKAKKELEDKISALEKIVEVTINIPQKYHSHFHNKRMPLVRIISEENDGVIIHFPAKDSTVDPDKVTIKGAKEFVETAKIRLLEVVEDLKQQINHEIEIDSKYHGSVMGTRAMNLVELEKKHKVKIFFPKKEVNNPPEDGNNEVKPEFKRSNKITIQGRKENCEKAAQDLFALVPINYEISVPFEFHRNIIGKKGVFLKLIQENYKVSTKMPKQEEKSDIIVLIGLEKDVFKAKEYIDSKIEELKKQKLDDEARSFNMKVVTQSSFVPKIIGKKGATINELRKNYDVYIQFSDEKQSFKNKQKQMNGDDKLSESSLNNSSENSEKNEENGNDNSNTVTITVTGYEKNVKNAVKKLNKIIKEFESFTVAKIHVDPDNYSKIIGTKGKNIKKLVTQFKVDIKFPNDGSDVVTISGLDKNVEACKEEIEKQFIVDEDPEMSMYLPPSTPTYSEIKIKPGKFVNSNSNNNSKGFFVRDAPWDKKQSNDNQNRPDTNNVEEFPSMNTSNSSSEAKNIVWVPK